MAPIIFHVQGSSPEPYVVTFDRVGSDIKAQCTCPAGIVGQYCKHRMRILNGDASGVVSKNGKDVKLIATWLPGSDVQDALDAVADAEHELEKTKKSLSAAKKELARILRT